MFTFLNATQLYKVLSPPAPNKFTNVLLLRRYYNLWYTRRMNEQQALDVLNKYFIDKGEPYMGNSTLDNWDVGHGKEKDIFSFVPAGGGRSNSVFLVKNARVFGFAPSEMGFKEAIEILESL